MIIDIQLNGILAYIFNLKSLWLIHILMGVRPLRNYISTNQKLKDSFDMKPLSRVYFLDVFCEEVLGGHGGPLHEVLGILV